VTVNPWQAVTKGLWLLQTAKKYKDFHLSLTLQMRSDGNSGVSLHTAFKLRPPSSQGLQFEIDPTLNHHTAESTATGVNGSSGRLPRMNT